MTIGTMFWVIYAIVLLVGGWAAYEPANYRPIGTHAAMMLLVFLLGWGTFGPIVHK